MRLKVSQKDLSEVFGQPWQDNFTTGLATVAFQTLDLLIDYQEKNNLVTSSLIMEARRKVQSVIEPDRPKSPRLNKS